MSEKILAMLQMQHDMNKKVHADWPQQGFEWYRAIWIESAELMDHHGWKWWKHQEADMQQIKLELVDIWHFGLSMLIEESGINASTAQRIDSLVQTPSPFDDFLQGIESFVSHTLTTKSFSVQKFMGLVTLIDLSFDDLYKAYVGKNVLNFFRQDHGYKDGTYVKVWNGKEDNEHLANIVDSMDVDSASFKDDLYSNLKMRYQEVVG